MLNSVKRTGIILMVFLVLFTSFVSIISAAYIPPDDADYVITRPKMVVVGTTATCSVNLKAPGQEIDATLELKQGSTVVASWTDSAVGTLTISGTATVTNGVTYTLTVSGTIDGVPFTPASITKTP